MITLLRLMGVPWFDTLEKEARARMHRNHAPGRIVKAFGPDKVPTLRAKTYETLIAAAVDFRVAVCEERGESWLAAQIRENEPVARYWALLRDRNSIPEVGALRSPVLAAHAVSRAQPLKSDVPYDPEPKLTFTENLRSLGEARVAVERENVRRRIANFDAVQAEKARDDAPDMIAMDRARVATAMDALRRAYPALEAEFDLVEEQMRGE